MPNKFDLNDTSPAAPAGRINIKWQSDDNGNVSAHVASSSGHEILDEATVLPARTKLAFVGLGVTATDDAAGDRTVVTIPSWPQTPWLSNIDAAGYALSNVSKVTANGGTLPTTPSFWRAYQADILTPNTESFVVRASRTADGATWENVTWYLFRQVDATIHGQILFMPHELMIDGGSGCLAEFKDSGEIVFTTANTQRMRIDDHVKLYVNQRYESGQVGAGAWYKGADGADKSFVGMEIGSNTLWRIYSSILGRNVWRFTLDTGYLYTEYINMVIPADSAQPIVNINFDNGDGFIRRGPVSYIAPAMQTPWRQNVDAAGYSLNNVGPDITHTSANEWHFWSNQPYPIVFYTSGVERLRIIDSGVTAGPELRSNGHIYAGSHLNMPADVANYAFSHVCIQNGENWLRWITKADFETRITPTTNRGYATSGNWNTDFLNTPGNQRRWTEMSPGLANAPDGNWYFGECMMHSNGNHGRQIAYCWNTTKPRTYHRDIYSSGNFSPWYRVVMTDGEDYDTGAGQWSFCTSGVQRMRIESGGNLVLLTRGYLINADPKWIIGTGLAANQYGAFQWNPTAAGMELWHSSGPTIRITASGIVFPNLSAGVVYRDGNGFLKC